jgi:hypothetical protein
VLINGIKPHEFHNKYLHYYLFEDSTLNINIEVKLIMHKYYEGGKIESIIAFGISFECNNKDDSTSINVSMGSGVFLWWGSIIMDSTRVFYV